MRRRAFLFVCVAIVAALPKPARCELTLRDAWLSGLAGYDSNVRRVSATNPPVGVTKDGDFRSVFNAGIEADLALDRFKASLVLQPFYIKYGDLSEFDRLDFYGTLPASFKLSEQLSLHANNTLRHINFSERSQWNRTYNNLRFDTRYRAESGWIAAAHYRFLYRDRPSPNLQTVKANGVGVSGMLRANDRVSLSTLLRYDFQSVDFVFPGNVSGGRMWADVSLRYQAASRWVLFGKYLFQRDEMDFLFDAGLDLDKLGEGAEAASDDILQSIRFLEDRDYNYRKHMIVVVAIGRLGDRHLVEGFGLVQDKRLDQRVLSVAGSPKRSDTTLVGQAAYSYRLTDLFDLFGYGRYERVDSNDPDQEYDVFTGGIGVRIGMPNR